MLNQIAPSFNVPASSELYQVKGSLVYSVPIELPGGKPSLAVGGEFRYESIFAPSGNSDENGPTQRYLVLNAFGAAGHRSIGAGFFELGIPILSTLSVNAAGRYDSYSSGQSAFTPKFGVTFTPVRQITIRGTYAEGFRIPSFGEANSLPTTGFVTAAPNVYTDAFLAQYGCSQANFQTNCPTYIRNAQYGLTTLGTPNLKPETARSYTVGTVLRPLRNVSITVDYYNIQKKNAIAQLDTGPALFAYYSEAATPPGFTLVPDAPDPAFPNAKPVLGFIESGYANLNKINTDGIEFGLDATLNVYRDIKFIFTGQAAYVFNLNTTLRNGTVQRFAGTLGNFNLTAGSGTQRWHAQAVGTLDFGPASLTGTMNYVSGYNQSAADQGNTPGDCGLNPGYGRCNVQSYVTVDLNAEFRVAERAKFYVSVLNVADRLPPIDTATYGGYLYNPVQGGDGLLGRRFLAGFRLTL